MTVSWVMCTDRPSCRGAPGVHRWQFETGSCAGPPLTSCSLAQSDGQALCAAPELTLSLVSVRSGIRSNDPHRAVEIVVRDVGRDGDLSKSRTRCLPLNSSLERSPIPAEPGEEARLLCVSGVALRSSSSFFFLRSDFTYPNSSQ